MKRTPKMFGQIEAGNTVERIVTGATFVEDVEKKVYTVNMSNQVPFKTGTLTPYEGGTKITSGFTVDLLTGVVTFSVPRTGVMTFDYVWIETIPTVLYQVPEESTTPPIIPKSRAQVVQLCLVNLTSSNSTYEVYAHGTAPANVIAAGEIESKKSISLDNLKIVLNESDKLAVKGNGIIATAYGILEEGID